MVSLIIIAVMVVGIGFLAVFLVKSLMQPKKIDSIKKLVKQGKYPQAEKLAKAIIQKDPKDYLAHYYLGKAYLAEHKNELALMEYKNVAQNALFDSQIPEAQFRSQLADLYMKFNQLDDAVKEYLLLTKLEPSNAENFFNAGKIYEQQGHSDMAMGFYQKTLQINKKHVKAHAAMGLLLFRGKDMRGAQQEISTAIQLSPETFSTYYYLGKILKESKDLPGAVKAFEKAVRDPDYKQKALLEKGSCFMLANAPDKAMSEFDRAIKASRNDHSQETLFARYFLAACHEKNRNIDKAIEQWQLIMQANKNFKDVASKLSQYKELQSNDSLKEYMTCGQEDLVEICKRAAAVMNFASQSHEVKKWGLQMIAIEAKNDDWKSLRKQMYLICFFRDTDPIEDSVVRKLLDAAKTMGCVKVVACNSSGFTSTAIGFAETRPIELVGKEKLEQILAKAGI